jgi:hypothetical protein
MKQEGDISSPLRDEIELTMNRSFLDEALQDQEFDVKKSSFADKMKSAMYKSDWSLVLEAVQQRKQQKKNHVDQVCLSMDKLLIKDKEDSQPNEENDVQHDTPSNKGIQEEEEEETKLVVAENKTHNLRPRRKKPLMLQEEIIIVKDEPFHYCLLCRKHFTMKSSLNRHMKTHNEDENSRRPYNCECGKAFSRQDNFKSHQKIVHLRQRDFKCSQCERAFGVKASMLRHLNTIHLKKLPLV